MGRPPTPWTDPRIGDICTTARGRRRKVTYVGYRGQGDWRDHPERFAGDWPDRVVYQLGTATKTCRAASWASWCRQAMAGGGTYEAVVRA